MSITQLVTCVNLPKHLVLIRYFMLIVRVTTQHDIQTFKERPEHNTRASCHRNCITVA